MPNLTMRRASAADVPAIVALLADDPIASSREAPAETQDYAAAFAAIEADPNQILAVAVVDDAVSGCIQLTFIPGLSRRGAWRCIIEGVRIAPRLRNQGYGAAMLDWAIGEARKRGCVMVQLTSDKRRLDAIRFYESIGFEASHQGMKLML